MEQLSKYILEKLRVTKDLNYDFTWDEFINALYKFDGSAFWLEDLPNISGYKDLPDFEYNGQRVKLVSLVMYDFHLENKNVDILYSPNEASVRKAFTIHNLNELNSVLDPDLISEIYNIISK